MVTLPGLLSSRSPVLSMVMLRLWGHPCPEQLRWEWLWVGSPLNVLGFTFLTGKLGPSWSIIYKIKRIPFPPWFS